MTEQIEKAPLVRADKFQKLSGALLRAAVLDWFEQAVNAFEGLPPPSEEEGKALVAEMLKRGWEGKPTP